MKKLYKIISILVLGIVSSVIASYIYSYISGTSFIVLIRLIIITIADGFIAIMSFSIPIWFFIIVILVLLIYFFLKRKLVSHKKNAIGFEWLKSLPHKLIYQEYGFLFWFVCNRTLTATTRYNAEFPDLESIPISKKLLDKQVLFRVGYSAKIQSEIYDYLAEVYSNMASSQKKAVTEVCTNDFFYLLKTFNSVDIDDLKEKAFEELESSNEQYK